MATFDQLGPRQRAILELILRRGKTYDEISGMLDMPIPRVRELAREALIELAPATSRSVDPQWRGQLSDYVLQQQSGPESRATVGHLRSSDAARLWASSLLDSLDTLYENGQPEIPSAGPAPERAAQEERPRRGRGRGKGPSAPAGASSWADAVRAGRSGRAEKETEGEAEGGAEEDTAAGSAPRAGAAGSSVADRDTADTGATAAGARGAAATGAGSSRSGTTGPRTAGARTAAAKPSGKPATPGSKPAGKRTTAGAAVAKRPALIAIVAGVLILALLVAGVAYSLSGDDNSTASTPPPPTGTPAPGGASAPGAPAPGTPGAAGGEQPRVLGEVPLRASPGEEGEGRAFIAEQGGQRAVVVQSRGVENVGRGELLEVWFYNSQTDAKSVGAQRVQGGTFQGLGQLPPDWQRYRFIDVSRERADRRPGHSGDSVLRGPVEAAAAGPARQP